MQKTVDNKVFFAILSVVVIGLGWIGWRVFAVRPPGTPPPASTMPSATKAGIPGSGVPSGRHSGGVNTVFGDGHSKWLRTGEPLCSLERGFPDAP